MKSFTYIVGPPHRAIFHPIQTSLGPLVGAHSLIPRTVVRPLNELRAHSHFSEASHRSHSESCRSNSRRSPCARCHSIPPPSPYSQSVLSFLVVASEFRENSFALRSCFNLLWSLLRAPSDSPPWFKP